MCHHSNESFCVTLSCGIVHYPVQGLVLFLGLRMKSKSVTIQQDHYAVLSSLAVYYHHFAEHCGAFRGPICSHARVIDPTGLLSFFFFSVSCIFSTPSKVITILMQFTFLGINMF